VRAGVADRRGDGAVFDDDVDARPVGRDVGPHAGEADEAVPRALDGAREAADDVAAEQHVGPELGHLVTADPQRDEPVRRSGRDRAQRLAPEERLGLVELHEPVQADVVRGLLRRGSPARG